MLHEKRRLQPPPMESAPEAVAALIDTYFNAYNAARLRESCPLFARMIDDGATIVVSHSRALTPSRPTSVATPLLKNCLVRSLDSYVGTAQHHLHVQLCLTPHRSP